MQELLEFQSHLKLSCNDYEQTNINYQYNIVVNYVGINPQKYTIQKTRNQISTFHQSLTKSIFELDPPFPKKYVNNEDPTQTVSMINVYLNHLQQRLDCLTSRHLINFLQFQQNLTNTGILTKEYVQDLADVEINVNDEQIVDMQWQGKQKILFVVSQCKKKTKIQNLLKLFISNETGVNGSLQMIKFCEEKGEWMKLCGQSIEAQPLFLTWSSKNSTLVVSSSIGVYIYMVGIGSSQEHKLNLIDFVELPGISSVVCDPQIASVYILSNGLNYEGKSRLSAYSIKKESAIQIPTKLQKAQSMVFQKANRRLYISDEEGIKIFKVQNDSHKVIFQNFTKIHAFKHQSTFQKLVLSKNQKPQYLFGYNKRGFITVFEVKPPEKEYLMNVLTNVQCPQNWNSIERAWSRKLFCVNFNTQLVFISMKNQPIFVKQNGISSSKIKKIIFDEQNQRLMFCDNKKLKICQIFL